MKKTIAMLVCLMLTLGIAGSSLACTAVYVGSQASEDGTTIIAKSNDHQAVWGNYVEITERVDNVPGRMMPVDSASTVFTELPATTYRYPSTPFMDSTTAYNSLAAALRYSDDLVQREYLAMRLIQVSRGYPDDQVPATVSSIALSDSDRALSAEEMQLKAQDLVFNDSYMDYKARIQQNVSRCTDALIRDTSAELTVATGNLNRLLVFQTWLTAALLLAILCLVIFIFTQVLMPISRMVRRMKEKKLIDTSGAAELRFVAQTYNTIFEENQKSHQDLTYEVMHDALTGLYNRRAYDMFSQDTDQTHAALLILDVDDFKSINDTYGHDTGDVVLRRVAQLLRHSFRSVDLVCRIGGDEFTVIMQRVNSGMADLVRSKVRHINDTLQQPEGSAPPASLSVGVAFSDRRDPQGDLFKDADTALYQVKEQGRCGCRIYGEDTVTQ